VLAIEGAPTGFQKEGAYWPQHNISSAGLGGFSYDNGFQYDYDSRDPDDSGYN
jgi:hypothetical protein